jgi:hypothetical protein
MRNRFVLKCGLLERFLRPRLGFGRITTYPEVIPKKCGSVRIGDHTSAIGFGLFLAARVPRVTPQT